MRQVAAFQICECQCKVIWNKKKNRRMALSKEQNKS